MEVAPPSPRQHRKELSGLFTTLERFQAVLDELCQPSPTPVTSLRLFHHEPHHMVALLQALSHCPPTGSVAALQHLDLYELDGGEGGKALKDFLSASAPAADSECRHAPCPRGLAIQSCQNMAAATLLGEGLAAPQCCVEELSLSGLSDNQLAAALCPLAAAGGPALFPDAIKRDANAATAAAQQQPASPQALSGRHLLSLSLTRCTLGASTLQWLPALSLVTHLTLSECVFTDAVVAQLVAQGLLRSTIPPSPATPAPQGGCSSPALAPAAASQQQLEGAAQCGAGPAVQSLVVSGGRLALEGARAVAALLAHPRCALAQLCLDNCGALGDAGAAALSQGLAANRTLRTLQLSHCDVGPAGADALAVALSTHSMLEMLALDYNRVGSQGLLALLNALCGPLPPPAAPGEVPCCPGLAAAAAEGPAEGYTGPPLRRLQLEGNWLRGAELAGWSPGTSPRSSAGGDLHAPGGSGGGMTTALEWVQQQQQQAQAGLTGGEAARGQVVHVRAPLCTLLLARNHLSDAGVRMLQSVLAHLPCSLELLDLSSNAVGPDGVVALVELLRAHGGLRELKLDNNRLHESGMQALLAAAWPHPALRTLRAEQCRVNDPEVKAQLALLQQQLMVRANQQQQQQHGAAAPARRPHRVGTRFPLHVYAVPAAMDDDGDEGQPTGNLQQAAAQQQQQPAALPAAVVARVRMGSRFPAHVYQRGPKMVNDHEATDEEDQCTPALPQPCPGDSGKPLGEAMEVSQLGVGAPVAALPMDVDVASISSVPQLRAHKRLQTVPALPPASGGLGIGAVLVEDGGTPSSAVLHPFRSWQQQQGQGQEAAEGRTTLAGQGLSVSAGSGTPASPGTVGAVSGLWVPGRHAADVHYPERYSVDLPWAVGQVAASAGPPAPPHYHSPQPAHAWGAPGGRGPAAGASACKALGFVGGGGGLLAAAPQHHSQHPSQPQQCSTCGGAAGSRPAVAHAQSMGAHVQHYLVARPSANAKRWSKPLTPEQQAVFEMF